MEEINFGEKIIIDESIEKDELHEYIPDSGVTKLNQGGEIRIPIYAEDIFLAISRSYLVFEGQLVNDDGTELPDDKKITMVNNAIMYLFSSIKYELSGNTIENIYDPGETTTMMGLLKYSEDFEKSQGMNQLWCRERNWNNSKDGFTVRRLYIQEYSDPKGYFSFSIPLKHIFGFAESYDKVLYGFKHQLTLVRKDNSRDALIQRTKETAADGTETFLESMSSEGKVRLDKLSWYIPHVTPSLEHKVKLMKEITNKMNYDVGYKMISCESFSVPQTSQFDWNLNLKGSPEKPRYIIIGFQNENDAKFNKARFDHMNLKNIYAYFGSRRYPEIDYSLDFKKNQYSRMYREAASFKQKYYNIDEILSSVNLTSVEYKDFYPLFVIDISKQSTNIQDKLNNIQIKATFQENAPFGTKAHAIIINDRIVRFQSDGSKFYVIS